MLKALREVVKKLPGSASIFKLYRKAKFGIYYGLFKGKESLFTDYYRINNWGDPESGSGYGSTVSYTEPLRTSLPDLFDKIGAQKVLDAPCGDMNWFKHILKTASFEYIGADIVQSLILEHQKNFTNDNITFLHLDITKEPLPNADIWLCRDCLIHFSNKDIKRALTQFIDSSITYLLTTSYTESTANTNILTGEHRFLNLELPPFNFPKPDLYIDDWIEGFEVKKLGLWRKETIVDRVKNLS